MHDWDVAYLPRFNVCTIRFSVVSGYTHVGDTDGHLTQSQLSLPVKCLCNGNLLVL